MRIKRTERSRFPASISMTRIPQVTRDRINELIASGETEADIVRSALENFLPKKPVQPVQKEGV